MWDCPGIRSAKSTSPNSSRMCRSTGASPTTPRANWTPPISRGEISRCVFCIATYLLEPALLFITNVFNRSIRSEAVGTVNSVFLSVHHAPYRQPQWRDYESGRVQTTGKPESAFLSGRPYRQDHPG